MSTIIPALAALLGTEIKEVAALSVEQQQQLLKDLQAAKRTHEKHLNQAMQDALGHLPWIIRGPVKKMFGL